MKVLNYAVLVSSLMVLAACSKGGDNGQAPAVAPVVSPYQTLGVGGADPTTINIAQRKVINRDFHASNSSTGQFSLISDSCNSEMAGRSQSMRFDRRFNDLELNFDGNGTLTVTMINNTGRVVSQPILPGSGYTMTNDGLRVNSFIAEGAIDGQFARSVLVRNGVYAKRFDQARRQFANASMPISGGGGFNPDYVPGQPVNPTVGTPVPTYGQNNGQGLYANFAPMEIRIHTLASNRQHISHIVIYNFRNHTDAVATDTLNGDGCNIGLESSVDKITLL